MNFTIKYTDKIEKDIKKLNKEGYNIQELKDVVEILESKGKLPSEYRPHKLEKEHKGDWECHIDSDWLLIWRKYTKAILLLRTGTHADLFV